MQKRRKLGRGVAVEQRTALVRAINDYMVSLTDLENELLERLSNAPDDILSDVALIEGLEGHQIWQQPLIVQELCGYVSKVTSLTIQME